MNSASILDKWINLYSDTGHLQARYNPRTQTLVIRERRVNTTHELSVYHHMQGIPADKGTTGGRQNLNNLLES